MTSPLAPPKIIRISCRAVTARVVRRELECQGGPWDGDRAVLEAGECSIDLAAGRYAAVCCTVNGESRERLQWTTEEG